MRYDLESMLPEKAFSPRGGRGPFSRGMTLEGGGKGGGGGSAPAPDPNIGLAQRKMADIQEQYLNQWRTEVWPQMKEQAIKQEARSDEQFALDKETRAFQTKIAEEQYQRYEEKFKPLQDKMIAEADDYNTAGNFERQAGLALGDIKDQFSQQREQQGQQMRAFGINPSSGRYQGMNNAMGVMEAATSASAATRARNAAEQLGWAKRMDAIGLGQGVFGNQATSTNLALAAGNSALQAGQVPMANYGQMSSSMGQTYGGATQGYNQVGNLGIQNYQIQSQNYQAEQNRIAQQNAGSSAGWGSLAGAAIGAAGNYYSAGAYGAAMGAAKR